MKEYIKNNWLKLLISFLIALLLWSIGNVKAMTIVESGSLTINEEYIYNEMFNATGYSIDDYPNIICSYVYYSGNNSTGSITCYSFKSIEDLVTSDYSGSNERFTYSIVKPFLYYKTEFTKSTGAIKNKTLTTSDSISVSSTFGYFGGNNSTDNSKNKTFSNFDFVNGSSLSSINSKINKLDFGMYMIKPAITIDYLNSEYEVLKTSDCYLNKSNPKCELDINDNTGSYIKITYHLKDLIGNNLDMLKNNTYQLRSKITGLTKDTKLEQFIYSYYFNDSTSNVNNALVYPSNVTHTITDNLHTYLSTFVNNTEYETISLYEFSEFYKTNGSSYTTISIPFTFVLGNLGADLNKVEEIQINNQTTIIDQNQAIIDQNKEIKDKLEEAENTRKGIWATIRDIGTSIVQLPVKMVESLIDGIKTLIIPDSFDFINDFKETIETKLGFIGSIPIQIIEFLLNLATSVFDEVTSIEFPSIEMFGVKFWEDMTIDLTPALGIINTFKHFTDFICVILVCNTLRKWYENFTGGGK